jgi:hypothetical protein
LSQDHLSPVLKARLKVRCGTASRISCIVNTHSFSMNGCRHRDSTTFTQGLGERQANEDRGKSKLVMQPNSAKSRIVR